MTPEELDLRRALSARSKEPPADFQARTWSRLHERSSTASPMPILAFLTASVLAVASVGVLLLARHNAALTSPGAASVPRLTSTPTPRPISDLLGPYDALLSAPSSNVVWGLMGVSSSLNLYRSIDRGNTWEQRALPNGALGLRLPQISFVSESEGWLAALSNTQCQTLLWHTSDAGATWQLLESVIADANCISGLTFVDSKRGYLGASKTSQPTRVYRTSDGGRTWAPSQTLPPPPDFRSTPGTLSLQTEQVRSFATTLFLSAWSKSQYVFSSTDAGATWVYLAKAPFGPLGDSVVFVTGSRWLQIIPAGLSVETTDAGRSWHSYPSDFSQGAPQSPGIVFADAWVGYSECPCWTGGVQRTLDGGVHWIPLKTPGL